MENRIGVYICHCGTNIAGKLDIQELASFASKLEGVVVAREYKYMCSDPGQEMIKKDIKELGLNRIVVAACSPQMHEQTFRRVLNEAGLNPYLFQMANVREQDSWVTGDSKLATQKAARLIAAAVRRVSNHEPLQIKTFGVNPAALVVGGGITGIEAALRIADSGRRVYLVEKEPSIGGHMAQFDKTFPTLDCAACILTPKMSSVGVHPNIELLTYSEVEEFSGFAGNFKVKIKKKARYVDPEKCTSCGLCQEKCPVKVSSEFDCGLGMRKAIYTPFPQAVPNIPVIDTENCLFFTKGVCKVCQKVCPADAVKFDDKDEFVEVDVGAVIVSTGFDVFDPSVAAQYGYRRYDNVVTSLEFERMCNASGPTGGKILLKSGDTPKSLAILHCIGSRDENYHEYCSRICCMQSMKFAHLVREKLPNAKVYEFYIDLRAFGKGYEEFYKRVLNEDVIFIRGKGAEVTNFAETPEEEGKLIVRCEDTLLGSVLRVPVDMVVLSVALEPRRDSNKVAKTFLLSRSKDGFFLERHPKLAPVSTTNDGIYIAGVCQGPKDIPDSVAQGGAAAAEVLSLIDRGKVTTEPEIAVIDEKRCSACFVCIRACPFNAIKFDEDKNVAVVQEALCKACGVCVAACPSGAIKQQGFTDGQIYAEMEGILAI
ncbi:MAG: CoB--CoM heterodisulfide reductase iron-sulfur subunit A family protein [Candidatus Bathyarchaeia archaeon]